MAYLAILSAGTGRRAGFAASFGIALGLLIVGVSAALGLAGLIATSTFLYEALRWGGVGYLFWLAWDGWRDSVETSPARTDGDGIDSAVFRRGLITNLLNPKAALFYVAVLPTFINAQQSVPSQTVFLSIVYVVVATAIHVTIVSLAGTARSLLDDPDRSRVVRRGLSLSLGLIAVWFAFTTAR